jgi:signal transduction histidine kinase
VKDEGPPIPENLLTAIFDPLVQVKRTDPRTTGLGLGRFIAKEIAIAHRGTIDLTSSERGGTAFLVRLLRNSANE